MQIVPNSFGARVREFNSSHEPAGSSKGGQFAPKVGDFAKSGARADILLNRAKRLEAEQDAAHTAQVAAAGPLMHAAVEETDNLGGGVNMVLLTTLDDGTTAVYKPEIGEHWPPGAFVNDSINTALTNKALSMAEREAMAYEVDQLLGTNLVPETVLRENGGVDLDTIEVDDDSSGQYDDDELQQMYDDWYQSNGGGGSNGRPNAGNAPHPNGGSFQRWVANDLPVGGKPWKFAVLDYALGTMDRHGSNVMHTKQGGVAIDNGATFPNSNGITFRSEPVEGWVAHTRFGSDGGITDADRMAVRQRLRNTDWHAFVAKHPAINTDERTAFLERIAQLTTAMTSPKGLLALWSNTSLMG